MFEKIKEKFSVLVSKSPEKVILAFILLINVILWVLSAAIISSLSLTGTESMGFWEAALYTIMMILDAGCISFVVADIGSAGVVTVIVCLAVIIIGMISFTGAVIGYITNYISGFIENSNGGNRKLFLSNHVVIINWNSRASEIINDMLYNKGKQKVVVLTPSGKDQIEKEIQERVAGTIARENEILRQQLSDREINGGDVSVRKRLYYRKNKLKNNLIILVREGDVFSTKQLTDISLQRAKTVIILGNDANRSFCKYDLNEESQKKEKGNQLIIKTLIQVAELTGDENSFNDQKIVVETADDWTADTVSMIVKSKHVSGKNNIVSVDVNRVLGILLSQFSIMPELNLAYVELLSNKGVTFYYKKIRETDEKSYVKEWLNYRTNAIPLTTMKNGEDTYGYYAALHAYEADNLLENAYTSDFKVQVNKNFRFEQKNVIILGHNSRLKHIMAGFDGFRREWNNSSREILNVIVIDDESHLEKMNYYKDYPYVKRVIKANIYNREIICKTIEEFVDKNRNDTSILVLSDDNVPSEEIDADVLTNLIYIRDIITKKIEKDTEFDQNSIDVVVEIINPKHYDVIKNYNIKNIVISNRYISKIIGQLGEKDVLYSFYRDILRYDEDNTTFISKELYVKDVKKFFKVIPPVCKVADLIRAVYYAFYDESLPEEERNHVLTLGYVKESGDIVLFGGDQKNNYVELSRGDKLIVFANH